MKLFPVVLAFTLMFAVQVFAAPQHLTFGVRNAHPFVMLKDGQIVSPDPGIFIEYLEMVATRTGITIQYRMCPPKRCFILLGEGKLDGVPIGSYNEDRQNKYAAYPMKNGRVDESRKTIEGRYSLYKLKNTAISWNGKHLKNVDKPIGVNLGYSITHFFKKRKIPMIENGSTRANMDMLVLGRVAGVAIFPVVGDSILASHEKYSSIIKIPEPLISKAYYLLLSHQFVKAHPDLANNMWQAAADIGEEGLYRGLLKKYMQ